MEGKRDSFDISKEIEKSSIPEPAVSHDVAEREEKIAESVAEIPVARDEIEERKKKLIGLMKRKKDFIFYILLSFLVIINVYIRSRNIPKLKDITTGDWILGPDLDPYLFLRWAKYIVEHGSIMAHDAMRNVPLGFDTAREMKLFSYLIAYFHKFLAFFSNEITVTYSAILFPVFMSALATIAFFLFARKIFYKEDKNTKNIIAIIATAFFILIPSLLSRTIAGIPEKESASFFLIFISFYFFLEAFTSKSFKKGIIWGVLSGIGTGVLALIWGGVIYVFFTIPTTVLLAFLLGKINKKEVLIYSSWILTSYILMISFSAKYEVMNLITSTSTGFGIGVLVIISISLIMMKNKILEPLRAKTKLPSEIFYFIFSGVILIIFILIILGPEFIIETIIKLKNDLITPVVDRFNMTVAENRQPYYQSEWKGSFGGPIKFNIPLYFWLFFIGAVALFNNLIKKLKKNERILLTSGYTIFLLGLIFSRYSSNSSLNGENLLSIFVYFGAIILFLGSVGYVYKNRYKNGTLDVLKDFNFTYLLYFIVLTLGIIGARGAIRLIMVLGAVSPVAVSFLIVKTTKRYFKEKDDLMKLLVGIVALLIVLASVFTLWTYYKQDVYTAENFAPGYYQWQWQKAMDWVRKNTSEDAVFAHWWDYGYWVQSIGERATILDGGNAISYWNHLMGRYVLTGTDEEKALEFLYVHKGTHLLIDSTEIGKYTAYSSIGSDLEYDRFSWISTFLMDESQTQETKNETIYIYRGGVSLDEDILWDDNGTKIFLPKRNAALGAIIVRKDLVEGVLQPEGIYFYQGMQYRIPLKYIFIDDELIEFEEGLEAGVFLFPQLKNSEGGISINPIGASMYLSRRTIHSHLVNFYLFDKESEYFKLAHVEDSLIVENLKQQGVPIKHFVYYQGFQGPIKIWEISYPENIKENPEFLETDWPPGLKVAKPDEYR